MDKEFQQLKYKDSIYFRGCTNFLDDLNTIRMTKLDKAQAIKISKIIEKECKVIIYVLQNKEVRECKSEQAYWQGYYNCLRSVKQFIKEDIRKDKQVKYLKYFKELEDKVPSKYKEIIDNGLHLY